MRSRDQALAIYVIGPVGSLLTLAAALGPHEHEWTLDMRIAQILGIVWAIVFLAWAWLRLARAGVLVEERGIRVVNPLRTHCFAWDEVELFGLGDGTSSRQVAHVKLTDGRTVPIFGITGPNHFVRDPDAKAPGLVRQLNEELDLRRRRRRPVALRGRGL